MIDLSGLNGVWVDPGDVTDGESSIDPSMLWPLLIMAIATKCYYGANLLSRTRVHLVEENRNRRWVRDWLSGGTS